MSEDSKYRVCSRCAQEKPLSEFVVDSTCKGGYRSYCKECKNASERAKYEATKEVQTALVDPNAPVEWDKETSLHWESQLLGTEERTKQILWEGHLHKAYKALGYESIEQYCELKLGHSRSHYYNLLKAAQVEYNLSNNWTLPPAGIPITEAIEIGKLEDPAKQAQAYERLEEMKRAGNRTPGQIKSSLNKIIRQLLPIEHQPETHARQAKELAARIQEEQVAKPEEDEEEPTPEPQQQPIHVPVNGNGRKIIVEPHSYLHDEQEKILLVRFRWTDGTEAVAICKLEELPDTLADALWSR